MSRRGAQANRLIQPPSHAVKLGELPATAICGDDISSSCLYVSALAIAYAGKYAWIALLVVSAVLYLYRSRRASCPSARRAITSPSG